MTPLHFIATLCLCVQARSEDFELALVQQRAEVVAKTLGVSAASTRPFQGSTNVKALEAFSKFVSASTRNFAKLHDLDLVMLDEAESKSRGSLCIDGSTPGFFYKAGTEESKWMIWLKGGGVCVNATDCVDYLPVKDLEDGSEEFPLFTYGEFDSYNHVMMINCDLGFYLGDRDGPVMQNGKELYSQGSRIVKHVIDVLAAEYQMTDVLLTGGSGGGFALFVGNEYFESLMPSSVTKFAMAPVNGWFMSWYSGDGQDTLKQLNDMHGMENTMSSKCKSSYGTDKHSCLSPSVAYSYLSAQTFMIQLYDNTWQYREDLSDNGFSEAWGECLEQATSQCDSEKAKLVKDTFENFTATLATYPTYSKNGMGGWISTCTVHIFYQHDDEFNTYAVQGKTAGAAVETWWNQVGKSSAPAWYLPCTLGDAPHVQCENTCDV